MSMTMKRGIMFIVSVCFRNLQLGDMDVVKG